MTVAAPLLRPREAPAPAAGLAFVEDEVSREMMRQAAQALGWPDESVRPGGVAEAVAALGGTSAPPLLVVDASRCPDVRQSLEALAEVCEPQTRVLVLGQQNDVALYRALIAMGVADYLVKPARPEQLLEALQGVAPGRLAPEPAGPLSTVAVIGSRGGVGATSLVASLGWLLAEEHQRRALLLDLDLQLGALALSMDIEPGRGLREILASPDRIDSLLVGSAAVRIADRLSVLAAEEPLDGAVELGAGALPALLGALEGAFDAAVIDVPRRLDALGRAALAAAHVRVVVTDLTLAGLRDARRLRALAQGLGDGAKVVMVGSRVGGVTGEVPRAEFERSLGAPLDAILVADDVAALAAAEKARPLAEAAARRPLGQELRRLANVVAGVEAEPARAGSWIKRLLGS